MADAPGSAHGLGSVSCGTETSPSGSRGAATAAGCLASAPQTPSSGSRTGVPGSSVGAVGPGARRVHVYELAQVSGLEQLSIKDPHTLANGNRHCFCCKWASGCEDAGAHGDRPRGWPGPCEGAAFPRTPAWSPVIRGGRLLAQPPRAAAAESLRQSTTGMSHMRRRHEFQPHPEGCVCTDARPIPAPAFTCVRRGLTYSMRAPCCP